MSQSGTYSAAGGGPVGEVTFLAGNTGGNVGPSGAGVIHVVGAGAVSVAGNPGTNTLTITTTGEGIPWQFAIINTAMAINNGYIANAVGTVQLLLPAVAPLGSIVRVCGLTAGGWQVTQNAGQQIRFGNALTTVGVGGSLSSTLAGDSAEIVCVTANTGWLVLSGVGNMNVV